MKKQLGAIEAVPLLASHSVPSSTYSRTSNLQCTNPRVGRVLEKIAFSDPGGINAKEAHRVFPKEHLDACQACRGAMLDYANRIALKEVATENGLSIEEVICELGRMAIAVQKDARQRGLPLRALVEELLASLHRD